MLSKLNTFYINRSIQSKMMIVMLFVLALTVVVLSYLNVDVLSRSFSELANEQTEEMAGQVTLRIENFLFDTNKTLDYIISEPSIQTFISKNKELSNLEVNRSDQLDEDVNFDVLSTLKRYTGNNRNIAGILVVDKNDYMISNTMKVIDNKPLTLESWYIQTVAEPDTFHVISQPIGRNITSFYDSYKADNILSVSKALLDKDNKVTGVILIDMKLDTIESIINSANLSQTGFLYIADYEGNVVYGPTNDIVHRIHPTMLKKNQIVNINGNSFQIINKETGISRWKIVGVFPQDVTLKIIFEVISYFAIYAVIIFMLASLLLSILTKTVSKPIGELKGLMEQAEKGELDVRFQSPYNDEISVLGRSFNSMIESIKRLLQLVYTEQRAKREAELRAFQAQIKPHFLYNTLDTINWMALEYEADDIVEVVASLTNLFRISLSKGNEIISLENEILHVSSYLAIQKIRYEEQFDYTIHYDKELGSLKVIKLIIQPLVENAIYHGVKGLKQKGFIHINIDVIDDFLIIQVKDSGQGMTPEYVEYINSVFEDNDKKKDSTGIGLLNVNERIKLNFGNEYGLFVTSSNNEGTIVTIKHPKI